MASNNTSNFASNVTSSQYIIEESEWKSTIFAVCLSPVSAQQRSGNSIQQSHSRDSMTSVSSAYNANFNVSSRSYDSNIRQYRNGQNMSNQNKQKSNYRKNHQHVCNNGYDDNMSIHSSTFTSTPVRNNMLNMFHIKNQQQCPVEMTSIQNVASRYACTEESISANNCHLFPHVQNSRNTCLVLNSVLNAQVSRHSASSVTCVLYVTMKSKIFECASMLQNHKQREELEKTRNRIINKNVTYLNIYNASWQSNIARIDYDRYLIISKNKHFHKVVNFIDEMQQFDYNILKNVIIYSGSALALYGITYTRDIDIIIFEMTLSDVRTKIWNRLRKETRVDLDICVYVNGEFISFNEWLSSATSSTRHYTSTLLHHNHSILNSLLMFEMIEHEASTSFTNDIVYVVNSKNSFQNEITCNSMIIGGLKVFSITLLERFYTTRYNKLNRIIDDDGKRHLVIYDMYCMRMYAQSNMFTVRHYPGPKDIALFAESLQAYSTENACNAVALLFNYILRVEFPTD